MSALADLAGLVVAELVTNAVKASTGQDGPVYIGGRVAVARLVLLSDGSRLVAGVYDQAPGMTVTREPRADGEGGRGLLAAARPARQWGWNPLVGQHGKVARAELA